MRKESLNPATVEKRFRELRGCKTITIAEVDQIPHDKAGAYCFFWTGFKKELLGKSFDAPAPKGRPRVKVTINKEWLSTSKGNGIPLYAGSSTVLLKRLRQHRARNTEVVKDRSTTTQVRKALQKIFKRKGEPKRLFEENVVVRYVLEENPITRFYLEHKLVGDLLPIFNVKPEH